MLLQHRSRCMFLRQGIHVFLLRLLRDPNQRCCMPEHDLVRNASNRELRRVWRRRLLHERIHLWMHDRFRSWSRVQCVQQ